MSFIGLTMRVDKFHAINEHRDSIDQRWISFIKECGYNPILLPNDETSLYFIKNLRGVVFTGGNSITSLGGDAYERDQIENSILDFLIASQKPIMGVCRGMQVIQSYFGIDLKPVNNHISERHLINFGKEKFEVNSYHKFGTTQNSDSNFKILAFSDDGIIEAIQHKIFNIRGIMWHPERETIFSRFDINLFKEHFQNEGRFN